LKVNQEGSRKDKGTKVLRRLLGIVIVAMLVFAIVPAVQVADLSSVPVASVTASDGNNNINLSSCDDAGYEIGFKLYTGDGQALDSKGNGGVVHCVNTQDQAQVIFWDTDMRVREDGSDWREDMWNFGRKANSGIIKEWGPIWNNAYITICLYDQPFFTTSGVGGFEMFWEQFAGFTGVVPFEIDSYMDNKALSYMVTVTKTTHVPCDNDPVP
jgi:hypothetical protein